jgi:hypothetical protein
MSQVDLPLTARGVPQRLTAATVNSAAMRSELSTLLRAHFEQLPQMITVCLASEDGIALAWHHDHGKRGNPERLAAVASSTYALGSACLSDGAAFDLTEPTLLLSDATAGAILVRRLRYRTRPLIFALLCSSSHALGMMRRKSELFAELLVQHR